MPISRSFLSKWIRRRRSPPGKLDIIHEVYSPELDNRRDIAVYLPASYTRANGRTEGEGEGEGEDAATGARYPVIYMHDGQNLFDPETAFAGEWALDRAIAHAPRKARRAIVVGIPNMGLGRLEEYSPFVDPQRGGGRGDAYLDFIVRTLKPLIDERYRTLPNVAQTGIAGSSLGGLISLYAFFRHPAAFGFAGALSPALWFANAEIFRFVAQAPYVKGRIYLDVGTREGARTLRDAREMRDLLVRKGYARGQGLRWVEDAGGMHNEAAWGRRFRKALPFLLGVE
ncbi:MAG: alpha/beta hydrolase [Gemmatimonadaceae bacterium]